MKSITLYTSIALKVLTTLHLVHAQPSCPETLGIKDTFDTQTTLYYSVVPSNPPGSNNGIFCGRLEVTNHDGWVGFAISENGKMADSVAIVGIPEEDTVQKYDLFSYGANLSDQQTLMGTSIDRVDGTTIMEFTKLLVEDGEVSIKEEGMTNVLLARGGSELGFHTTKMGSFIFLKPEVDPTPPPDEEPSLPTDEDPSTTVPTLTSSTSTSTSSVMDEGQTDTDTPPSFDDSDGDDDEDMEDDDDDDDDMEEEDDDDEEDDEDDDDDDMEVEVFDTPPSNDFSTSTTEPTTSVASTTESTTASSSITTTESSISESTFDEEDSAPSEATVEVVSAVFVEESTDLSCPSTLDMSTVIDASATLYYATVPSNPPGSNNGIFCGRLEVDNDGWVGFAVSEEGVMPGSLAIIGIPDEDTVQMYDLYEYGATLSSMQTLRDTSIDQVDGKTIMEFTKLLFESKKRIAIAEGGQNNFLYAKGGSALGYHTGRQSFTLDLGIEPFQTIVPTPTPTSVAAVEEVETTVAAVEGEPTGDISCPETLEIKDTFDTQTTLYYSVVPSNPPGSNNGIFCGRLEVTNHDGWVGFAISENGKMADSVAIVGIPEEDTVQKYDLFSYGANLSDQQTLMGTSIDRVDGTTIMEFTKLLVEDGEVSIKEEGMTNVLLARGGSELGFHTTKMGSFIFLKPEVDPTPPPDEDPTTTVPPLTSTSPEDESLVGTETPPSTDEIVDMDTPPSTDEVVDMDTPPSSDEVVDMDTPPSTDEVVDMDTPPSFDDTTTATTTAATTTSDESTTTEEILTFDGDFPTVAPNSSPSMQDGEAPSPSSVVADATSATTDEDRSSASFVRSVTFSLAVASMAMFVIG